MAKQETRTVIVHWVEMRTYEIPQNELDIISERLTNAGLSPDRKECINEWLSGKDHAELYEVTVKESTRDWEIVDY